VLGESVRADIGGDEDGPLPLGEAGLFGVQRVGLVDESGRVDGGPNTDSGDLVVWRDAALEEDFGGDGDGAAVAPDGVGEGRRLVGRGIGLPMRDVEAVDDARDTPVGAGGEGIDDVDAGDDGAGLRGNCVLRTASRA
jgi:hypothetical protein